MPVNQLRLLIWLKFKLTMRGYRKSKLKILSTAIFLICSLILSIAATVTIYALFKQVSHPWVYRDIARDALAIIFLIWSITPLLGYQLNEWYDLTKLFPYPISYKKILLGAALGGLLDFSVLTMLPPLAFLSIYFSSNIGERFACFALLLLFVVQTIALGQAITLTLSGFLQSRRFKDITIVLFPLIGLAAYIGQQTFVRQTLGTGNFWALMRLEDVVNAPVWRIADWLPPGYAASGLEAVLYENWGTALLWSGTMTATTIVTLLIAATALRKLYLGDAGPITPAAAHLGQTASRFTLSPHGLLKHIPLEIATVALKEFVYLKREPIYKAMAVQSIYTLAAILIPFLLPFNSGNSPSGMRSFLAPFRMFGFSAAFTVAMIPLIFNVFGGEGAAITILMSLPTRRRDILLGKNLAHVCLLIILNVLGLILGAAITRQWNFAAISIVWVILSAPVLLAAGNLASIFFPHRMMVRGQKLQKGGFAAASDGSGCAYAFLYSMTYVVTLVALIPVTVAVLAPYLFSISLEWYAFSLPLAAAYSLVIYVILLGQGEIFLSKREPEIAAKIVPVD